MTDRELLQQALDALISVWNMDKTTKQVESIQAIKARLEQPNKEWVGLTDADVNRFIDAIYKGFDIKPPNEIEIQYFERLIKFIETRLKEKNNGNS